MTATRWLAIVGIAVGCTAPRSLPDGSTTDVHVAGESTGTEAEKMSETAAEADTPPTVRKTLEDPQDGTTLTRTAHVREQPDGSREARRRRSHDERPRLELVPLGGDLFVRAVNDRPRASWVILYPRRPGNVLRELIELVAVDADGKEWPAVPSADDCSGGSAVLMIPPDTTLGLGRARAYQGHAVDHSSWLHLVFEGAVMAQIPGSRAEVRVRWSGTTPAELSKDEVVRSLRARYREASDLRLGDIFVLGEDDVSNTVEIIAEPDAGVVHPTEPTSERLPMPADLHDTAREIGLE